MHQTSQLAESNALSINQSINQPINQSINQSTNQSINQSITGSKMSWHLVTNDDYILGDAALHYNTKNLKLLKSTEL